ncbi:serine/threonine-protein kinase [Streptomyces sp. NPDC059564]|uniref:serine/threonine-protein kinase n=1 Tax=Streptomyces sp. NPDC059564 TaxID=3346865 RepID=UPI00368EBB47
MSELPVAKWIGGGRYGLVRELGSGGFGRVWMAQDTHLDRTVAIKEVFTDRIPAADLAGFIKRAHREASNSAALSDHPNIVSVYDLVNENGVPWIVMQLIRGASLAGVLREHPAGLTEQLAAQIAEHMLLALKAAHAVGLVHRDVKPQNIMIMADGQGRFIRSVLADFGLAKSFVSDVPALTRSGEVFGSWAYAAPERRKSAIGNLPPGDLFSLGVVLFEAVEGYSPFQRDDPMDSMMAVVNEPLPIMQKAGHLAPLIKALTAKDPADRPSIDTALSILATAWDHRDKTAFWAGDTTATSPLPPANTKEFPADPAPPSGLPATRDRRPKARSSRLIKGVGIGALITGFLLLVGVTALWLRSVTFAAQGDCVNYFGGDWSYDASCSMPSPWGKNYLVLYATKAYFSPGGCPAVVADWTSITDVQVTGFQANNGEWVSMCLRPIK